MLGSSDLVEKQSSHFLFRCDFVSYCIDFTVDIPEDSEYMYWNIKNKLIAYPTDLTIFLKKKKLSGGALEYAVMKNTPYKQTHIPASVNIASIVNAVQVTL